MAAYCGHRQVCTVMQQVSEHEPLYDEEFVFEFVFTQRWRHLLPETHEMYRAEDASHADMV